MQPKWRAPACYVGVAMICALYLAVVPGVSITDICAGAGLGAAIMWAINEWETGKWNVALPGQALASPVAAGQVLAATAGTVAAPAPVALVSAPPAAVTAIDATQAKPTEGTDVSAGEPRPRVDSGVATPETLAKWEIDEKEPSWDASALAETWAKLRRELSISGPRRPQVSPDLPRTAQLAKGPLGVAGGSSLAGKPSVAAAKPSPSRGAIGSSLTTGKPTPAAPAKPALGSLSKAYQESQRNAGGASKTTTSSKPAVSSGSGSLGATKASYTPGSSFAAPASASTTPARKVAGGAAEPARTGSFLRPGTMRPR